MPRRMGRRLSLLLLVAAMPLALWAALPLGSSGQSADSLRRKIERKQAQIEQKKGRERVLTSEVSAFTRKIGSLQADITVLQTKQVQLQANLDAKRAELARIQEELRRERLRLARLRRRLAETRVELANRLVQMYKEDTPDMVTVVLEADGFADLLERTEFLQRSSAQDTRIISRVRDAKIETKATADRLDRLEEWAEEVAAAIEVEVSQVVQVKGELVSRRESYASARAGKAQLLANTRASRQELEHHVDSLQREQVAVIARLRGPSNVAGPIRQGSGQLIWPASGSISSGFGWRWGRLHAGVDIPLPERTPLRAADGGSVAIAGSVGGYGNYTCIQHGGSLSTCYGHQSSIAVSVGQSVSQGQVIGYSGNTGHSTGPHVHFEVRINGSPVDPLGYL
jgi:murein DD-endopeptidase MepM/ murein hydrolase activator NlpD